MTIQEQAEVLAEARRGFNAACVALRPDLHRFCTRMTGSPCDGEDVLQEALVGDEHLVNDVIFTLGLSVFIPFSGPQGHGDSSEDVIRVA